jgi:hypothetical protein
MQLPQQQPRDKLTGGGLVQGAGPPDPSPELGIEE